MTNKLLSFLLLTCTLSLLASCSIYRFRDVSIDPNIKTVRIGYIENKSRLLIPQLSPQLSERLREKVNNQTRLTQVQSEEADYDITGFISRTEITTSGVSDQRAATNRLIVSVTINLKNRLDDSKSFEAEVSRDFDFSANLSLEQAQSQLLSKIVQNLSDEIFNRIFSNW
jgi:outer membrane lipopolysaccharide assembly protein LptE/RlpB